MCGLVGIAGNLEYKDEACFKRLLVVDYFRGTDSTGVARVKPNGDVDVVKVASHPIDLFDTLAFTKAINGVQSSVFLGHNRAATKGKVNAINAHPFQFDHIVGAHNGTLSTASFAELEKVLGEQFEVDSKAIFAAISRLGIEETAKYLQGAWALVWVDTKEHTLNFLRNKERPLWYAYSKDFDKLFWASEHPMINLATEVTGQAAHKYELHDSKGYCFFPFEEDKWYKFDLKELETAKPGSKKPKPLVKTVKGKEPAPVVSYYSGGAYRNPTTWTSSTTNHGGNRNGSVSYLNNHPNSNHNRTNGGSTGITDVTASSKVILSGSVGDPYSGFITEEAFEDIAKHGCGWCQETVEYDDIGTNVYMEDETVLCKKCSTKTHTNEVWVSPIEMRDILKGAKLNAA